MLGTWRRFWLAGVLVIATLSVAAIHVVVNQFTDDPPNYTQVEDGLWLGGFVAQPPRGTRAVLNLCELEDPYCVESHRWEPIQDAEPAPGLDWLREQIRFIETERAMGRTVFVHCRNGVSRSGMVVVAYVMARNRWPCDEAMAYVRSRRRGLRPNPAFRILLSEWERVLKDNEGGGRISLSRCRIAGEGCEQKLTKCTSMRSSCRSSKEGVVAGSSSESDRLFRRLRRRRFDPAGRAATLTTPKQDGYRHRTVTV